MQPSRGVDDHDVSARADRVVGDRGRVAAALAAHELGAGALRPDLELLLGRCAEGVGGADGDRAAVLAELLRELADRRRLAGAVDADDEDHRRAGRERQRRRRPEQRRDLLGERLREVAHILAGLEPRDELGRRLDADVGAEQRLLEPLPRAESPGSKAATASCSVSARRERESESRSREANPRRATSVSYGPSASPRNSAQLLAMAANATGRCAPAYARSSPTTM